MNNAMKQAWVFFVVAVMALGAVTGLESSTHTVNAQSGGAVLVTLDYSPTGETSWVCDPAGPSGHDCYEINPGNNLIYDVKCLYGGTQTGESHWLCTDLTSGLSRDWSCKGAVDGNGLDFWSCTH